MTPNDHRKKPNFRQKNEWDLDISIFSIASLLSTRKGERDKV
jgi:hypothetical protein